MQVHVPVLMSGSLIQIQGGRNEHIYVQSQVSQKIIGELLQK